MEFSSDLYVLKPRDPQRGNGAVLYEVSNRGGKGMLAMFDRASSSYDPRTAQQFGDGFLLEQGYTLVWLGWQFDVPRKDGPGAAVHSRDQGHHRAGAVGDSFPTGPKPATRLPTASTSRTR